MCSTRRALAASLSASPSARERWSVAGTRESLRYEYTISFVSEYSSNPFTWNYNVVVRRRTRQAGLLSGLRIRQPWSSGSHSTQRHTHLRRGASRCRLRHYSTHTHTQKHIHCTGTTTFLHIFQASLDPISLTLSLSLYTQQQSTHTHTWNLVIPFCKLTSCIQSIIVREKRKRGWLFRDFSAWLVPSDWCHPSIVVDVVHGSHTHTHWMFPIFLIIK